MTDLILSTFEAVGVLLVIGILGFLIIKRHMLPGETLSLLTPLAIEVGLPALIFANIIRNFRPDLFENWGLYPLWWAGFTLYALVLSALFCLMARRPFRRDIFLSLFFQNAIFFPLPILMTVFGESSVHVLALFLFTLFHPSFYFSIYPLFFPGAGLRFRLNRIFNPVLVCTLIAVSICLTRSQDSVPRFLLTGFGTVGAMTVPILMLMLGGNLYLDFRRRGRIYFLEIYKFVMIKNILFPLLWLVVLVFLRPPTPIALVSMFQSAMPPSISVPAVIEKGGGSRNLAAQCLTASTVLSLVTLPAALWLFTRYYVYG